MRHLLVGDDVTNLPGIGLNAHGVSLYRYGFAGPAHGHLIIQANAIANLQDDALLLRNLESSGFHLDVVMPNRKVGSHILPITVAGEMVGLSRFDVSDRNRRTSDGGATRVRDCPDDSRVLTECLARKA